jgi:hypothetical protein
VLQSHLARKKNVLFDSASSNYVVLRKHQSSERATNNSWGHMQYIVMGFPPGRRGPNVSIDDELSQLTIHIHGNTLNMEQFQLQALGKACFVT